MTRTVLLAVGAAATVSGLAGWLATGSRFGTDRRLHAACAVRRCPAPAPALAPAPAPAPARRGGEAATGPGVDLPPDLALELVAGLLDAGTPVRPAVAVVEAALRSARLPAGLAEVVDLSERTGLPAAALLRARADDLRRARDAAHGRAVRRLAVLLVLPMGLCLLPAFVLLGVVPVLLDLLSPH